MKNLVEKLPDQQPALRVMAMPPDTNQYGDVFGGWIMSQVDLAGSSIASRVANSRTATVAVTSFTFKEPVWVGDVVSFYATVLKVGTTSITVDVTVFAERLHKDNHRIVKVTEAQLVFVALNKDGRPQPSTERTILRPKKQNRKLFSKLRRRFSMKALKASLLSALPSKWEAASSSSLRCSDKPDI